VSRAGSIASRIKPLGLGQTKVKMVVYGRSGTGKTRLYATFPKKSLLIRAENGIRSIHNVKGIDVYPSDEEGFVIKDVEQMHEILTYLQEECPYESVGLDTASALEEVFLANILGLKELPPQKSWGLASRDQYGQLGLQMKEILRKLLALPCHVMIIAQERNFNDDNTSDLLLPYVSGSLSPKTTGWLNAAADYIGQTFIRDKYVIKDVTLAGGKMKKVRTQVPGVEFCLRTGPNGTFTTKFRNTPGTTLPEVLVDPTYDKICKIIGE